MIGLSNIPIPCAQICVSNDNKNLYCLGCDDGRPGRLPPPPPPPHGGTEKELIVNILVVMGCVVGGALILGILLAILREYCFFGSNDSRRRNPPILFATEEEFVDEERGGGQVIDHPIWYINTIGLQQSVIDLITIVKYKKDEGLIEGTDCSVCLGEFQEDEGLRLLPKCSHAFHVSCIDTWLRSHKNCPLCRAPIVNEAVIARSGAAATNSIGLGSSRQENQVENLESQIELRTTRAEEGSSSDVRIDDHGVGALPNEDKNSAQNSRSFLIHSKGRNYNSDSQVLSDLGDSQIVVDEDVQPMRRSVSLDCSSASMIYKAVANVNPEKCQENSLEKSSSRIVSKRSSGNSSINKLMKSSSIGPSLQKGPVSMKLSSSSARFFSSKSSRSQGSILPL